MNAKLQIQAIRKLSVAGEKAGFIPEQMIELLNSGMRAVALLDLIIIWRFDPAQSLSSQAISLSGWGHVIQPSCEVTK